MQNKRLEVFTFGHRYKLYPRSAEKGVLQCITNVAVILEGIPSEGYPAMPGTDPEVLAWILMQLGVSEKIEHLKSNLRFWINMVKESKVYHTLRVYYHCNGGYHRSPGIATAILEGLNEEFGQWLEIAEPNHLTLEWTGDFLRSEGR